jgi:hypothetical protein
MVCSAPTPFPPRCCPIIDSRVQFTRVNNNIKKFMKGVASMSHMCAQCAKTVHYECLKLIYVSCDEIEVFSTSPDMIARPGEQRERQQCLKALARNL